MASVGGALPPVQPHSWWWYEAMAREGFSAAEVDERKPESNLAGQLAVDVCIVGGGYAGLWTAWELSERAPWMAIAVVDRDRCGSGASSRNGGLFSASWQDAAGLVRLFGKEQGLRYATALADETAAIAEWIQTNAPEVPVADEGMGYFYTTDQPADLLEQHREAVELLNLAPRFTEFSQEQLRAELPAANVAGAMHSADGATVQPALLARALVRLLRERGVLIFEDTHVRRIRPGSPVVVYSDDEAEIAAGNVIFTTGAWATGWHGYRSRLGNVIDYVLATEPIPDVLDEMGLQNRKGWLGGRQLIYYFQRTHDDRLVFGGGDAGVGFSGRVGRNIRHNPRAVKAAVTGLFELFPQLKQAQPAIEYAWGGAIDMAPSFVPAFWTHRSGNIHSGVGFSGHGLAATRLGGRTLASLLLEEQDEWADLPVVGEPVGKAPPEPLRWPLVRLAAAASVRSDRLREAGRKPWGLTSAIANAPEQYRSLLRASSAKPAKGRGRARG